MPTEQPSSAPQNDRPQPTDDLNAPAVLHDDAMDQPAGGGGLGGADASANVGGDTAGKTGAATPNSPIDARLPHGAGDEDAAETRSQAVTSDPIEPGHGSR